MPILTCGNVAQESLMAAASNHIMTIEQLAGYLKISRSTLYKLAQGGKLPGQKVGKRWRFHKPAIDRWLGERSRKRKKSPPHGTD